MKKTDLVTTLIAILLFAAMLSYIGVYCFRALSDTTVTADALAVNLDVGGSASGIVVREEVLLSSDGPYVDVSAKDGEKVARGSSLAMAMSSDLGLERAARSRTLEAEIARMRSALQGLRSAEDLTGRDELLASGAAALASAAARHRVSELDGAVLNLSSLLLPSDSAGVSEAALARLEAELESLHSSTASDTTILTAEEAGTFSSVVDGFEHLGSADLADLTVARLEALMEDEQDAPAGTYGKLVTDYRWYFAAVMDAVDAARLTEGRWATLNFGRYYGADVPARVVSISRQDEGRVAVVFRCDTALADTLAMRLVTASVVFEHYSGIRIPSQAVQTDPETETTFVWCVTAMQLERKELDIIYSDAGFVIARRGSEPNSLREGNTVVVSGKDLYEGKVMG